MPGSSTGVLALSLVVGLAGCSATGPSEGQQLDAARARWARSGLDGYYQAELTRACFCGFPDAFARTHITVVEGTVIGGWELDSGNAIPPAILDKFPTVQTLFGLIADEIAAKAAEVRVDYHPTHGAPMQIYIDRIRNAIDDELTITIHLLDDGVLDAAPARLR